MKRFGSFLLGALLLAAGCPGANGGDLGVGGSGGSSPTAQSSYGLECTIDTLLLEMPIDLFFELDGPYIEGGSASLTFSATVGFDEATATALIGEGIRTVDIIAMRIRASIDGATPTLVETSLAAGINDFDLEVDTDENGIPGPHRIELDTVTIGTEVNAGADLVELSLGLDGVSLVLGDFEVPIDCLSPTLVGFSARFPVEPTS